MKTGGNKFSFDIKDSPILMDFFSTMEPGKKFKIELGCQMESQADGVVKGIIESYAPEGYKPDENDKATSKDGMAVSKREEPVMLVIKGKKRDSSY